MHLWDPAVVYTESDADWLNAMVTIRPPGGGLLSWVSAFSVLVREARLATGRNMGTGVVEDELKVGNWLGALGYLVLLDQIGECFEVLSEARRPPRRNDFVECLADFAPWLLDDDMLTLYALRCAFAHSYALTNVSAQPKLTHRFLLVSDDKSPLITYPKRVWSGKHSEQGYDNQTHVNLRVLGDLVESTVLSVQAQVAAGTASVKLAGGIDELRDRFTVSIMDSPR